MKIVVNTRLLLPNKMEGIGWFTFHTLKRIVLTHPEHEFIFLFDRKFEQQFIFAKNIKGVVLTPQSRHPVLWYLWFQWIVNRFLAKTKPDLFLSPDGYLPLGAQTPTLSVIHDIAFEHYPEFVPFLVRKYYRYFFRKFAKEATRIATVSTYTKEDLIKTYKIHTSKIDVVYNGIHEGFKPQIQEKEIFPYFIYIGSINKRKNLLNVLKAYVQFREQFVTPVNFILVGNDAYGAEDVKAFASSSKYKNNIQFLGRIESQKELNTILGSALAMVYVPWFEGFGIPCLEAMQCGVPVITSNSSSLPEVCGKAALYSNPEDINSIANNMLEIVQNPSLREELILHGNLQKKKFSWDKTAELLWESILKTVNRK